MAQTTEAACLLQTGSMYSRRLGLRTGSGEDIFAGVKPGAVSIYFGDAPIYHFDLDGRWQRAFLGGVHYLKGLDASVHSIDREREGGGMVLRRKTLPFGRSVDLDDSIRAVALGLIDDLDSGRLEVLPTPQKARPFELEAFRAFLERVTDWNPAAWFAHRERYLATYGPIPFLPPDCPNALVLQATLGDQGGRSFGRRRPAEHYVRSLEEFRTHIREVSRLIGRRIAQSRGIFLAGANLLSLSIEEILFLLESVREAFPLGDQASPGGEQWDAYSTRLGTVHAFLDDFRSELPDLAGWHQLRSAQLGRVTLGVESGDPETLSLFGKSWNRDDLSGLVTNLKSSGIGVGLVVLVGSGGRSRADAHLAGTTTLLSSLPLDPGDLVSLVDARSLDEISGDEVEWLSDEETAGQVAAIKERSAAGRPSKGPKVVAYNPDKQWG